MVANGWVDYAAPSTPLPCASHPATPRRSAITGKQLTEHDPKACREILNFEY